MDWSLILIILLISIGVFVLYTYLNITYLNKLKVNKWILLVVAVIFVFISLYIPTVTSNKLLIYLPTGIFIFFFLWYLDANKAEKKINQKSNSTEVIRPKANPNRVKQFKKEDIIKTENNQKKHNKKHNKTK